MAELRRLQALSLIRILPSQVQAFSKIIRRKLQDRSGSFGRDYLRAVVNQVVVHGDGATISGSHAQLRQLVASAKSGRSSAPLHERLARLERFKLPTFWFVGVSALILRQTNQQLERPARLLRLAKICQDLPVLYV